MSFSAHFKRYTLGTNDEGTFSTQSATCVGRDSKSGRLAKLDFQYASGSCYGVFDPLGLFSCGLQNLPPFQFIGLAKVEICIDAYCKCEFVSATCFDQHAIN